MNIESLASFGYYFNINPGGDFLPGYALLLFFVLLFFAKKLVVQFGPKDKYFKKSLRKNFWPFSVLGVAGVIFVISRFAVIPYFSMRVWLYITLLLSLLFLVRAVGRVFGSYQKRLNSVEREKAKK